MDKECYDYYASVIKHVGEIGGMDNVQAAKLVKKSFFKKMLKENTVVCLEEPPHRWALEILYQKGALK